MSSERVPEEEHASSGQAKTVLDEADRILSNTPQSDIGLKYLDRGGVFFKRYTRPTAALGSLEDWLYLSFSFSNGDGSISRFDVEGLAEADHYILRKRILWPEEEKPMPNSIEGVWKALRVSEEESLKSRKAEREERRLGLDLASNFDGQEVIKLLQGLSNEA